MTPAPTAAALPGATRAVAANTSVTVTGSDAMPAYGSTITVNLGPAPVPGPPAPAQAATGAAAAQPLTRIGVQRLIPNGLATEPDPPGTISQAPGEEGEGPGKWTYDSWGRRWRADWVPKPGGGWWISGSS